VLLVLFAIFVFGVCAWLFWARAQDEPAGTRLLWFASVVALGCAFATNGEDLPTAVKVGAYAFAAVLIALTTRAQSRAGA
jgi:uncharacterized membrane protein